MAVERRGARSSYEETRKQRVEENKRRMQELGIMVLSNDLKGMKQKSVSKKPLKRKSMDDAGAESRRSSRVAGKPAVSYKDQLDLLPGMRARCGTRERQGLGRRYVSDVARRAAYEAAEEAFKDIKNPGFVKAMLHSHVTSCFWLGLPNRFCQEHMPLEDERFILEDDRGEEWECLYLPRKTGMSGGWRGFSLDHELVDGDSCIFELVSPLRFKVHFFRCDDELEEVNEKGTEAKAEGRDTKTEKKASKVETKKKAGLSKAKKSSKSSSKKLKIEDGEDDEEDDDENNEEADGDDEGDDYAPRVSKRGADTTVSGPSRASRRKLVKKEDGGGGEGHAIAGKSGEEMELEEQKGKEPDDLIELQSGEDEDQDKDARRSAAVTQTNQGGSGSLSSGRATRNSLRRSLPPSSTT